MSKISDYQKQLDDLTAQRAELDKTAQLQTWRQEYLATQAQALAWPAQADPKAAAELARTQADLDATGATLAATKQDLGSLDAQLQELRAALAAAELDALEADHRRAYLALCKNWAEVLNMRQRIQEIYNRNDALLAEERALAAQVRAAGRTCEGFTLPARSDAARLEILNLQIAELSK